MRKIKIFCLEEGVWVVYDHLNEDGECFMDKDGTWYKWDYHSTHDDEHKTPRDTIRTLKKIYPHAKKISHFNYEI